MLRRIPRLACGPAARKLTYQKFIGPMIRFSHLLKVERITWIPGTPVLYLAGNVDFPDHRGVTVVLYAPKGTSLEDPTFLANSEQRCNQIVTNTSQILRLSCEKARHEISKCYRETNQLPADELLSGMTLEYVKLSRGFLPTSQDELIFKTNKHFHGLDLCLFIDDALTVTEVSLDG